MNIIKPLLLVPLLAIVLALSPALAQEGAKDPVVTATALLDHLDAGEFEAATANFNAQMRTALDAGKLQAVQSQINAAGPVKSRDEAKLSSQGGFTVVVIRIHREHASLDATIAIDADGKVGGLHFAPAAATAPAKAAQ